jgi:biopolymer transport protein TolR
MNTGFGRLERRRGSEPMSQINVTPLVDVMLVLVVIFILTAPLLTSSIKLALPTLEAGQASDAQRSVSLVVDRAGQTFVDDRPLTLAELSQHLQSTATRHPDAEVQLRADENAPYGKVIEVLGLAQQAGLTRIGFVTNPPPARSSGR